MSGAISPQQVAGFSLDAGKSSRILARALALLLALAAFAKGYSAWRDHNISLILWAQIMIETGLAAWLASGVRMEASWRTAMIVFGVFASVSLFKVMSRQRDCGCFGRAPVSPEIMFLVDLTIVILLIAFQPRPIRPSRDRRGRLVLAGIIAVGGLTAIAIAQFGRPISMVAKTNAEQTPSSTSSLVKIPAPVKADMIGIATSPTQWVADFGVSQPGKFVTALFRLSSPRHRLIAVRGVNTSCSCTSVPNPPQSIPADGTSDAEVKFHVPDHPTIFESDVMLTTDDPTLPPLKLIIKGSVQ